MSYEIFYKQYDRLTKVTNGGAAHLSGWLLPPPYPLLGGTSVQRTDHVINPVSAETFQTSQVLDASPRTSAC